MITVYAANCADFSNNGLGALDPISCEVTEALNGDYSAVLTHGYDADGKWKRLTLGAILKIPVPANISPALVLAGEGAGSARKLYKTSTTSQSGTVKLRAQPLADSALLAAIPNGRVVALVEETSETWWKVLYRGTTGYAYAQWLTYYKTETVSSGGQESTEEEARYLSREQPFRIYRIEPGISEITVSARHLFYDLASDVLRRYQPHKAAAGTALNQILSKSMQSNKYKAYTNITATASADFAGISPCEAIMGADGFLELWKGELLRDWYDVYAMSRIGQDRGLRIRYGKDLTGLSGALADLSDLVTRAVPVGEGKNGDPLYLPEIYVDSPHVSEYDRPYIGVIDVSDARVSDEMTTTQAYAKMREAVADAFAEGIDLPAASLTIDWQDVRDCLEYADAAARMPHVYLGDTVGFYDARSATALTARVMEYTFDSLTERYIDLTLGSVAPSLASTKLSGWQLAKSSIPGRAIKPGTVDGTRLAKNSITWAALGEACKQAVYSAGGDGRDDGVRITAARTDNTFSFTFPYGAGHEMTLELGPLGVNECIQPVKLFKDGTLFVQTDGESDGTDWIGPYWLVRATGVSTAIPTPCNCVGGNHGTSGHWFPTGERVSVEALADGIALTDGETREASVARIVAVNRIHAGNRIDPDTGFVDTTGGTDGWSLEETVTYTVTAGNLEVQMHIRALEAVEIGNAVVGGYCGLQIPGYIFPGGTCYFGDRTTYQIGDATLREYRGVGDRAVLLSGTGANADAIILYTNREVGMGDRRYFGNNSPSYYKSDFDKIYGHLIWQTIALAAGESIMYCGGYSFTPVADPTVCIPYAIKYNGEVSYCVDFLGATSAPALLDMPEAARGKAVVTTAITGGVTIGEAVSGAGLPVSAARKGAVKFRLYEQSDLTLKQKAAELTAQTDAKLALKLDAAQVDNFTILTKGALIKQTADFAASQPMVFTINGFAWKFRKSYLQGATIVEMYVCVEQACTLRLGVLQEIGWNTSFGYYVDHDVTADGWYQMVLPDDLPDVFWLGFFTSAGRCVPPAPQTKDSAWPYDASDAENSVYTGYPGRPLGVDWYLMWAGYDPVMRFYADVESVPNMQEVVDYVEAAKGLLRTGRAGFALPYTLHAVRGDYLEVFRGSIIRAADAACMGWDVAGNYGKALRRLWHYDVGAYDWEGAATFYLYDQVGNLVDQRTVVIDINDARTSPESAKNILIITDKYPYWIAEFMRRLTGTGGSPAGLALTNLSYVYTTGDARKISDHTGTDAVLDLSSYTAVDYCYIFLGHNDLETEDLTVRADMAALLDAMHTAFPSCQIVLMGPLPPNEDARGAGYLHALARVQAIGSVLKALASEITYFQFTTYVDTAAQFDAEYGYPTATQTVNARSTITHRRATGDWSLSTSGNEQVADAAYRVFHALT